jgi:hypothetical protein
MKDAEISICFMYEFLIAITQSNKKKEKIPFFLLKL